MKRRALLTAFPAVAVLPAMAAGASPALAEAETPIVACYRRYMAARDALEDAPEANTDEQDQSLYDTLNAIEDEMMALT